MTFDILLLAVQRQADLVRLYLPQLIPSVVSKGMLHDGAHIITPYASSCT